MEALAALVTVPLVAFGATYWLVTPAQRLGRYLGIVDRPRRGEVQVRTVARTGGYAMFAAFFLASLLSLALLPRFPAEYTRLLGVLLGALLILPIALLDDILRLGPLPQFVGQAVVAVVPMVFGVLVDSVANPFGGVAVLPEVIVFPITFLWFMGMMNTVNFIDTMDGVAAGVAGIAGVVLAVRSIQLEQYSIAVLVLAMAGACAGFLPHNLHPAKVFMGTSGSMFLGFGLAALAILGGAKIATTTMVLAVPILDTGLVILQRTLRGRSPFQGGDGAHLPHRLLAVGLSQRAVVYLIYLLCAVLGALSLALSAVQKFYTLIAALLILGAVVVALYQAGVLRRPPGPSQTNPVQGAEPEPPEQI
ncbi:MAG: undecaprenyl/decaprenyl-phosphate alpha-N-acetylglucosaminyl 1-phosphate transferase [Chloroflexi bacterium]|nr:undecaprenyl/decaprenyl-phosphate alpha-N-acetylglucosaminyl 1-phosphate transferase [Chloroflexota bacterium]MCL5026624.1 undecaprenyl/decaprenyl-phosphate alpha-N-acetylglucosaminyl 1-phosphate transferase [Chloroflexota bacterium]